MEHGIEGGVLGNFVEGQLGDVTGDHADAAHDGVKRFRRAVKFALVADGIFNALLGSLGAACTDHCHDFEVRMLPEHFRYD